MSGTKEGVLKTAAIRIGISFEEYLARRSEGLKHCWKCQSWKPAVLFDPDRGRADGHNAICGDCRHAQYQDSYVKKGRPERNGPAPLPARDGDKRQARKRVNQLVLAGRLPHASDLPCFDCGHQGADRRHQYDHHLGYAAEHHLSVQAVCEPCHIHRETVRGVRKGSHA